MINDDEYRKRIKEYRDAFGMNFAEFSQVMRRLSEVLTSAARSISKLNSKLSEDDSD